ncbi:MAG: precorrin-6y C5,15-methyltransferase (decarboxylating) subunit CbiE [Pirellulales bacterium]|nr:precorrin-6y C5,15-methyltransferase (decarboxylating) subunit CbiE [Pirellulales bacterium]
MSWAFVWVQRRKRLCGHNARSGCDVGFPWPGGRATPCPGRARWSTIGRHWQVCGPFPGGYGPLSTTEKVHIIGIGENGLDGLTAAARQLIERAELLVGEVLTLAMIPESEARRLVVGTHLDEASEEILAAPDKRVVVLASGDPLFYGVARYLCEKLGKQRFEVVPHVSSMQLAFARVKESWEEAFLTNLATHSLHAVLEQIRTAEKVGLFTSEACPPSMVAKTLLELRIDYFTAYVCENLNSPDERVTQGELSELVDQEFAPLNVMILVRKPHVPDRPAESIGRRLFGNPDDAFLQSKPKRALLTPGEIRAMALAEMDLGPGSIVWDIGAGSGSVAVEAAQIAKEGTVYAIEQDLEDHQLIVENAKRFAVSNLVPVLGRAPEAWADLPDPDSVFVGGSGRGISRLVDAAYQRLRVGGRLVATISSVDNLAETHRMLHAHCRDVKVWMVNFARGNYQFERVRFESVNPVFLVSVVKPG